MMKIIRSLLLVLFLLNLTGCIDYNLKLQDYHILIDKINLNMEYKIMSKDGMIRDIIMFEECGRPNIEGSNTVIGAHSGSADYAYFNELYLLEIGDIIRIVYNGNTYSYEVTEIKEVSEMEVDVLKNNGKSILTLLTCKIGDNTKRLIVIGNLTNGKN